MRDIQVMCLFLYVMKRFGNIIFSVFLSLMVVYLAGGVAVVRCCHTGMSGVAFPMEKDACADECPVRSPCMSVTVIRLVPYTKPSVHDFSIIPNAICSIGGWRFPDGFAARAVHDTVGLKIKKKIHLPPVKYLRLLGILLI